MKLKGSKWQELKMCNNKEEEGLNEFKDKGKRKDIGYIPLLLVTLL